MQTIYPTINQNLFWTPNMENNALKISLYKKYYIELFLLLIKKNPLEYHDNFQNNGIKFCRNYMREITSNIKIHCMCI